MPLNTCTVYRTQQPVFSSFTVHTAFIWTLAASSILNYKKETSTRQHLFLEAPLKPLLDTGWR